MIELTDREKRALIRLRRSADADTLLSIVEKHERDVVSTYITEQASDDNRVTTIMSRSLGTLLFKKELQ